MEGISDTSGNRHDLEVYPHGLQIVSSLFAQSNEVCSYKQHADCNSPIKYPDRVTVLHKLRSKPKADTDHLILDVLVLSELHRRVAARCVEDIVIYDYKAEKKCAMEAFMIDRLQETFELQEQAKQKYGSMALGLIQRVKELEKGSWNRADAKEDFGSANV